jgi:hypothetical protein
MAQALTPQWFQVARRVPLLLDLPLLDLLVLSPLPAMPLFRGPQRLGSSDGIQALIGQRKSRHLVVAMPPKLLYRRKQAERS